MFFITRKNGKFEKVDDGGDFFWYELEYYHVGNSLHPEIVYSDRYDPQGFFSSSESYDLVQFLGPFIVGGIESDPLLLQDPHLSVRLGWSLPQQRGSRMILSKEDFDCFMIWFLKHPVIEV